ncbi:hypothetical protein [Aquirhabdus sp.]|uniref:hypothetical protein n=1 Tax=Aquirhabdus sp. TaxID=2824160 RepID=UPI00396C957A
MERKWARKAADPKRGKEIEIYFGVESWERKDPRARHLIYDQNGITMLEVDKNVFEYADPSVGRFMLME